MFANRFTALIDACSLAGALNRNLLLSLAEADFFRVRWSRKILDETEEAISKILKSKGAADHAEKAASAKAAMVRAFADAEVSGYDKIVSTLEGLPDPKDAHVIAAAIKTRASIIVTENAKHFPAIILTPLDLEAKSADAFIADTIDLDAGRAVAAIRQLRLRLKKPEKTGEALLFDMEAAGLTLTVDILREHVMSL